MLKGLEAVEIPRSKLNQEVRYEAEFFQKKYLREDSALAKIPERHIGDFSNVTDGPHGYHVVDELSPIAMLTAKCAKDWFTDRSSAETIAESVNRANKRSELEEHDIILSTRGTVGMCALVTKEVLPANIDQDVARISWSDKESIQPEFVIAFLNSKFGQSHIRRYSSGMVQQGLSLQKVREIPVPLLAIETQSAVAMAVREALEHRRDAALKVESAERNLLCALGLENWQAPEPLTYVRRSGDAFAAGRLDAEHFQERYVDLRRKLTSLEFGFSSIGDLSLSLTNGAEIREYQTNGTPYLRVGDIRNFTVDGNSVVKVDTVVAKDEMEKVGLEVGDVLVSRSGSLAVTAVVEPEWVSSLISSHLIRLRISDSDFDPYYVALFLAALPGRMQIQQWSNGGVQPEISQPSLRKVIVPCPPLVTQQAIREAILAARVRREHAAQLLHAAKRAVEIAIEDGEAAALVWLAGTTAALADPAASCGHADNK